MSEEIQTTQTALATVPAENIELTATAPDEIRTAQVSLIRWAKDKIAGLERELAEVRGANGHAEAHGWASGALSRMAVRCEKRIEFYSKMLSALEHGYVIIPNFPVTVFAIRTERDRPLKMLTTYRDDSHEQKAEGLEQGQGDYKNPFPPIFERTLTDTTKNPPQKFKEYWCEEWSEMEFPLTMAKSQIMEATTRAMALKAFDDFGIMPSKKHEDPIIVARLKDPRSTKYNQRWVTFMVAWHLNTRDL